MSFLFSNLAPIMVALVASVLVWTFGGTRGELLIPIVPWLFVLLIEVMICFPQRRMGETSYSARDRAWKSLKRDPLVWVSFALFVLLLIPFVNNGLCPICDYAKIAEGLSADPPVPFLPYCVNRIDHLNVVLWFAIALSSMIVAKHSLSRSGKRLVLELIMWNGVAVAALGFLQSAVGAPGPLWNTMSGTQSVGDFFATFGYPNMGGDYFTTLCGISVALWRYHYEEIRAQYVQKDISHTADKQPYRFWSKHYFLIPAIIFFYAAINTLSRAAIILVTVTASIYFLHAFVTFLSRMHRARRMKVGVISLLALGLLIFFSVLFMPDDLQREVDTLNTDAILQRVTGKGQYHVSVATQVWKDNKMFGCGGWGYKHLCIPKMLETATPDEVRSKLQMVGGINVHNDYLQFMAEHGLVGFGLMGAIVVLLIMPIARAWYRMAKDTRFMKRRDLPPKPVQIFILPAPVFCILISAIATLIHSFGDCPLRSPAVLMLFFVSLAALPGFMPKKG